MRFFAFLLTLSAMMFGFLAPAPARAGLGADLAVAGCGAVAGSMLATEVAVDPHRLAFTALVGDVSPESQTILVECYDFTDDFSPHCGGSLSVDQPWLKLDRTRFYGADAVAVTIDPSELTPGAYEGTIHVGYDFVAIDDSESVTVELVVQE